MKDGKVGKMSRRAFVGSAVAASALVSAGAREAVAAPPRRPNILFILADDMGWGDLSCYGRPDYETPNLDALARQGVRMTQAYSASPVCTPTRCAFLTGRYPARTPIGLAEPLTWRKVLEANQIDIGLDPQHPTIASLLKEAGYRTALVGKWHLGYLPKYSPLKSGFEEFFGLMSGGTDYFKHTEAFGEKDLYEMEVPVERAGYVTDLLTERAIKVIRSKDERPFYLSLHYTAPHWPWEGPRDRKVSETLKPGLAGMTAGGSLKVYAELMRSLDENVGRVIRTLDRTGLSRSTIVIFTSDNGGERFSYIWPFRGEKFQLYEGGIRVPAIARWPGVVPAGRTSEQVSITMDWTATLLALAGARPHPSYPLDGVDLLPHLQRPRTTFERKLFWRNGGDAAARVGRWKYLLKASEPEPLRERLFDLSADEREQADFKDSNKEVFERLREEYAKWNAQMLSLEPEGPAPAR